MSDEFNVLDMIGKGMSAQEAAKQHAIHNNQDTYSQDTNTGKMKVNKEASANSLKKSTNAARGAGYANEGNVFKSDTAAASWLSVTSGYDLTGPMGNGKSGLKMYYPEERKKAYQMIADKYNLPYWKASDLKHMLIDLDNGQLSQKFANEQLDVANKLLGAQNLLEGEGTFKFGFDYKDKDRSTKNVTHYGTMGQFEAAAGKTGKVGNNKIKITSSKVNDKGIATLETHNVGVTVDRFVDAVASGNDGTSTINNATQDSLFDILSVCYQKYNATGDESYDATGERIREQIWKKYYMNASDNELQNAIDFENKIMEVAKYADAASRKAGTDTYIDTDRYRFIADDINQKTKMMLDASKPKEQNDSDLTQAPGFVDMSTSLQNNVEKNKIQKEKVDAKNKQNHGGATN